MKHLIRIITIALVGFNVQASVISSRDVVLPVDISTAKVVFTNKGYGQLYLVKVLVPALSEVTVMDHRNVGEGAPCMATYETHQIDDVVKGHPATEQVSFHIELEKSVAPDTTAGVCHVFLTETLSATIRGYQFVHDRSAPMPDRVLADCN